MSPIRIRRKNSKRLRRDREGSLAMISYSYLLCPGCRASLFPGKLVYYEGRCPHHNRPERRPVALSD